MSRGIVPLVDLAYQVRAIADEVRAGFDEVMAAGTFVGGAAIAEFESEFAEFCGVGECVAVGNGTDALELALRACGIGRDDHVLLPTNSFVATAEAVTRAGAHPVLADCDTRSLLLDAEEVRDGLTPETRAVVPVHLFGQLAPMERLASLLVPGDVILVEDAAQAHGATRNGAAMGSTAAAAATSFYPGKNLGAFGDAGAVVTRDDATAARLRALRDHGGAGHYEHELVGCNSRLDTLQAVVLRAKLRRLSAWNDDRRRAAARYDELLAAVPGVRRPAVLEGNVAVWHLYVVRVPARDDVLRRLRAEGILAGVHYPAPIHLQPAFRWLGYQRGDFPAAEAAAAEILSLPIFPGISEAQQDRVVDVLTRALEGVHG